jgi:superfamily I DNA/RNA helicase
MLPPTQEQQAIIDEVKNCVVLAKPGSGKTFTVTCKIRQILPALLPHQGVIALSYTNKASNELKDRCLAGNMNKKASFFGTIDSFFLSEIIIPFGSHVFGRPGKRIDVIDAKDTEGFENFKPINKTENYPKIIAEYFPQIALLYRQGWVVLQSFGFLGAYIYNHSLACRRYLKARYTTIIIDEYQDCGDWQHLLFLRLVDAGLQGIAVGDPDQSIYECFDKYTKYLIELPERHGFVPYQLNKNHRSHPSIINYSLRLLSPDSNLLPCDEIRVYKKQIIGSETQIGQWLTGVIPTMVEELSIPQLNQVVILVKTKDTAKIIQKSLELPHKPILASPFDEESSAWGRLFIDVLAWLYSEEVNLMTFVERYLDFDYHLQESQKVIRLLKELKVAVQTEEHLLNTYLSHFISIADTIYPTDKNSKAVSKLDATLQNEEAIKTFKPAAPNEVQIRTLHSSKGLEFDLVFHLNLYEYILPKKEPDQFNKWKPSQLTQDLNLHYVGITRAKKCCVICTSTSRTNWKNKITRAQESEFLSRNDLPSLRKELEI